MRVALHSTLRDGAIDDYLREHARVPDDLRELFGRAGIRDWAIWRSGDRLFHVIECDDFDEAMRVIRADEADARWQAHIGRFVEQFLGPDGEIGYLPLETVWSLEAQLKHDRRRRSDVAIDPGEAEMGLD